MTQILLRDALVESGKIAIALVVIRTRQHLAAVKPQKKGLMLEFLLGISDAPIRDRHYAQIPREKRYYF